MILGTKKGLRKELKELFAVIFFTITDLKSWKTQNFIQYVPSLQALEWSERYVSKVL
jgi:hypothetical protein